MIRRKPLAAGFALAAVLVVTGCSTGSKKPSANVAAPALDTCLIMPSVSKLTSATPIDCAQPHHGQVFALIALPATITDPSVAQQITKAKAALGCPSVKAWAGYTGTVPLGLFRTWQLPTKQQIAAGARWTACVAILAPGPDHTTLKTTVGTLDRKLAGITNPLPLLGQCAATHTNSAFTPVACVPGSTQWVWLGAHRKPVGTYPGQAAAKKAADAGCTGLVQKEGGGGARVYYPTSATAWTRAHADWSCWMPIANVKK